MLLFYLKNKNITITKDAFYIDIDVCILHYVPPPIHNFIHRKR